VGRAAAFEDAAEAGKPLLLALTVPWSSECREMDRRTYGEPRIAANVNDGFVPLRVDADRHPRVRERYNMGGFPSTVFLTPEGKVLSGATYLGPDGFRDILDGVRETWDARRGGRRLGPRSVGAQRPAGWRSHPAHRGAHGRTAIGRLRRGVRRLGSDVKFPMARTVEFALVRARDQATRTLEAIRTHLRDTYDGGFYRFATNRDWSEARSEKLLDENAAILRAFAHAYRYTGEEAYRETAEGTVEYLTTTLWDGEAEAFAGSQAGDSSYVTLQATEREDADAPHVDDTVFADRNGVAVDALCTYAAYTDDEHARRYAARARDHVVEQAVDDDGAVIHYADPDAGDVGERGLLLDQARVLRGLTTSWQVLGEGGPATAVADWTVDELQAESGAFRDGPVTGAGLLSEPQYPPRRDGRTGRRAPRPGDAHRRRRVSGGRSRRDRIVRRRGRPDGRRGGGLRQCGLSTARTDERPRRRPGGQRPPPCRPPTRRPRVRRRPRCNRSGRRGRAARRRQGSRHGRVAGRTRSAADRRVGRGLGAGN